jgi:hypothetical protein
MSFSLRRTTIHATLKSGFYDRTHGFTKIGPLDNIHFMSEFDLLFAES